jgi:hypothetical protein
VLNNLQVHLKFFFLRPVVQDVVKKRLGRCCQPSAFWACSIGQRNGAVWGCIPALVAVYELLVKVVCSLAMLWNVLGTSAWGKVDMHVVLPGSVGNAFASF